MDPNQFIGTLFLLLFAHALCDYPLQGDFLSKAKNRKHPIPGVPWYQAMGAHSLIHGGAVFVITGYWVLGVVEAIAHFLIDDVKCQGHLSFNQDQVLHIGFKVLYATIVVGYAASSSTL